MDKCFYIDCFFYLFLKKSINEGLENVLLTRKIIKFVFRRSNKT